MLGSPAVSFAVGPNDAEIAAYDVACSMWRIDGVGLFPAIDFEHPVQVHFEAEAQASATYGPFNSSTMADGTLRADNAPLAYLDDSDRWCLYGEAMCWARAMIFPHAPPGVANA